MNENMKKEEIKTTLNKIKSNLFLKPIELILDALNGTVEITISNEPMKSLELKEIYIKRLIYIKKENLYFPGYEEVTMILESNTYSSFRIIGINGEKISGAIFISLENEPICCFAYKT
jgi:hypothetical protein